MKLKLSISILSLLLAGCGSEEPAKVAEAPKPPEAAQPAAQPTPQAPTKVEYPDELVGKWASGTGKNACKSAAKSEKLTDTWTGIQISKTGTGNEAIGCTPTSLVNVDGGYVTNEDCGAWGDEWKTTAKYSLNGDTLKIQYENAKGEKSDQVFTNCKIPVVKICQLTEIADGATYKDEKLTKESNSMLNSNQGWWFKTSETISANGKSVLVGQLCNSNECGPKDIVGGKKVYTSADEWNCK